MYLNGYFDANEKTFFKMMELMIQPKNSKFDHQILIDEVFRFVSNTLCSNFFVDTAVQ